MIRFKHERPSQTTRSGEPIRLRPLNDEEIGGAGRDLFALLDQEEDGAQTGKVSVVIEQDEQSGC